MRKSSFLCFVFATIFTNLFAQGQINIIQNIKARNILNLDGKWHYIVDPYNTGDGSRFFSNKIQGSPDELVEYDFSSAPTLSVPGDWNSQQNDLLYYEGAVWYERDFVARPKQGKRYFLNFGAVNYKADVYLNGRLLGTHEGGFTPFQFEVTDKIEDGDNFIVVKADNTRYAENVPAENFDWWNYGGITRDVVLAEMNETYINDYSLQLTNDMKNVTGYVQLNGMQTSQQVTVQIMEANLQIKIPTNSSGRATFIFPIKNIEFWSPENPQLYTIKILATSDTTTDHIGFRTIETKGKNILLNGKPIFLRGVCLHEENPMIPGRPRSKSDLKMLLSWAKELNCNYVRLTHYPHNEYMSQLADEMGLLLWEEVPVYWSIDWENNDTYESAKQQLSELIYRDKNRASVIIWSIGNETPNTDTRNKFMGDLADHVRRMDTTRLVSAALLGYIDSTKTFRMNDSLGKKLDLLSFNEYIGWYIESPAEIPQYNFAIDADKPVIISEFGAEALGGFYADTATRFSEEMQELFYKNQFKLISDIPALRGTSPWVLVDFRSPKRLNPIYQEGWNRKGLYTETGKKKKAFFVVKGWNDAMQKKYGK
ncbi:beta-glucuronidase [Panacibacter ginsenosidivorans]|uniref:Beta-glucuronidase n=1 Tax=Panacibacter ginsenosidivorans TaxID=1813871 RepID=A0A5B8V463_9BACT|nr:glycoside hydrolase family 2 TIM barrel-domain containing protein [Panacibacter ginsenosidivorans]QEC65815.1 beta-glucuronidase [Panacibacter ginsenosidivorans]